jgi:N utilization substance protein B
MARRCAVQALYQWQLSGTNLSEIERQFLDELGTARTLLRQFRAGRALTDAEQSLLEELLENYCRLKNAEEAPSESPTLHDLAEQCCPPEIHEGYFKELLHNVPGRLDAIDAAIGEFSDRPVAEIDPVERAILRISGYELLFKPDVPYRVVVNEGINLAKDFGATQSHKYINGILDKVARKHRAAETASRSKR